MQVGQLALACFLISLYNKEFLWQDTFIGMTLQVALYTFVFAIIEKVQKERFIINLTN